MVRCGEEHEVDLCVHLLCRQQFRLGLFAEAFSPVASHPALVASPLLRYVSSIQIQACDASTPELNSKFIGLLAQHAPNLQSLGCKLAISLTEALIFTGKLQSLNVKLDGEYTGAEINGVLTALVALPSLSRLCLELPECDDERPIELGILSACPSLTDLALESTSEFAPSLNDAQVEHRWSLGHLHRMDVRWMNSQELQRYLQPPVTARWQDIGRVHADDHTGELLLRLPSLTKSSLVFTEDAAHIDYLPQLTQLTALKLACAKFGGGSFIPADALLSSLVRCSSLTELVFSCGFTSAHWSALFAKLPLRKFWIDAGDLESLQCFAAGPITETLEELTLDTLDLPPSEVSHLYGLRRLRALHLDCCFSSRMDDATIDSLFPPTPLLPALTEFRHIWQISDNQCDHCEQQGPSFRWMQDRCTQ